MGYPRALCIPDQETLETLISTYNIIISNPGGYVVSISSGGLQKP